MRSTDVFQSDSLRRETSSTGAGLSLLMAETMRDLLVANEELSEAFTSHLEQPKGQANRIDEIDAVADSAMICAPKAEHYEIAGGPSNSG